MPFANLKVPAGSMTLEQKQGMVDTVTDMYAGIYGDDAQVLTLSMLQDSD